MSLRKEELILLHSVLARMKEAFEEAEFTNKYFRTYEELSVRPLEIHRSKKEHKEAIVVLCRGISQIFEKTPFETILENSKLQKSLLHLIENHDQLYKGLK